MQKPKHWKQSKGAKTYYIYVNNQSQSPPKNEALKHITKCINNNDNDNKDLGGNNSGGFDNERGKRGLRECSNSDVPSRRKSKRWRLKPFKCRQVPQWCSDLRGCHWSRPKNQNWKLTLDNRKCIINNAVGIVHCIFLSHSDNSTKLRFSFMLSNWIILNFPRNNSLALLK